MGEDCVFMVDEWCVVEERWIFDCVLVFFGGVQVGECEDVAVVVGCG